MLIVDYKSVKNVFEFLMEYCKCIKIGCVFICYVNLLFFEYF